MSKARKRKITLSAEDDLIEKARVIALKQGKNLNELAFEWLKSYAAQGKPKSGSKRRKNHSRRGE